MANTKSGTLLDWTAEESYWRNNYSTRPYIGAHKEFDYWRPAYRYGYDSAKRFPDRLWEDVEHDLVQTGIVTNIAEPYARRGRISRRPSETAGTGCSVTTNRLTNRFAP